MTGQAAWNVIGKHLEAMLAFALTLSPGEVVPAFCDVDGRTIAFRAPSGSAVAPLCRVRAPRLEDCYDVRPSGDAFENGDGERVSRDDLPRFLADCALSARDGGAEWGWEFEVEE